VKIKNSDGEILEIDFNEIFLNLEKDHDLVLNYLNFSELGMFDNDLTVEVSITAKPKESKI